VGEKIGRKCKIGYRHPHAKIKYNIDKKIAKKDWKSPDDECSYPMLFQKNLRNIRPTKVSNTSLSARCSNHMVYAPLPTL